MVPAAVRRMSLGGFATAEGTRRYRDRLIGAGVVCQDHFRGGPGGLALSSIGLGTYLGTHDDATDALYLTAIMQAVKAGCNVIDSAINYRCQRSERVISRALTEMIRAGTCRRDEVLIATKGGFIPYDGEPPRDSDAYVQKTFVMPGIFRPSDVVADCHCMTPTYLRHQIDASLANLGIACLDLYYLHNPETQLEHVPREEFTARMRAAFTVLEEAVAQGKLRVYGTATWDGYRVPAKAKGHLSLEALVRLAEEVGGKDHHFKVIQLPYNLGMLEALVEKTQGLNGSAATLLEAAKALGIYVMISGSILQGKLSQGLPAELQQLLGDGTDAQRSLQFVRSTPGIGTALVGMKRADHVRDNLALAKREPLLPEQIMGMGG
jgi:aryl-alcohol dehydrogenase-like predicted oxidoreductase